MHRLLLLLLLLPGLAEARPLRVAATTPDLAAVSQAVGGDHVQVTPLSLPTQDPHWVDARPNLAVVLARADLLLLVGLDLEVGWLPTLVTGSRNASIQPGSPGYVDCSGFVDLLGVPAGRLDRSMGDVHAGGNPHYNFDPRRMVDVARGIAARMTQLDPPHADIYAANLAVFEAQVQEGLARWAQKAQALEGLPVVTYHRSFPYLADFLHLHVIAAIEPKPGIPPTPSHVQQVAASAKAAGAKVILQESWFPTRTSEVVRNAIGAKLVSVTGGTDVSGGQDYVAFVDGLVDALVAGAGG